MSTAITTIPQAAITENNLEEKAELIKSICAKDCTAAEFGLLCHLAVTYQLDPLARQIWAVKVPGYPAQIFAGRDGYLAIAHRSGVFDGMESGTRKDDETGELVGWAKVYRKDVSHPFSEEVYFGEYARGLESDKKSLWKDKPRTMIQKVAEAQALRKAFSISGLYSPEEMPERETGHVSTCAGNCHNSPAPTTYVRAPPKVSPKGATKPAENVTNADAKYAGNATDCTHCFRCGRELQGAEPMVSHRDYQQYLCIGCMQAIDAAVSPSRVVDTQKPAQKPPMPPLCVACGKSVSSAEMDASLKVGAEVLCSECLSLMQDEPQKPKESPGTEVCQTCGEKLTKTDVLQSKMANKPSLCPACLKQAILIDRENAKRRGTA